MFFSTHVYMLPFSVKILYSAVESCVVLRLKDCIFLAGQGGRDTAFFMFLKLQQNHSPLCVYAFFRVHCHNLYVLLALRNSKSICLILGIGILCSYYSDRQCIHKASQFFLSSLSVCFLDPPFFFNNFIGNLPIDS